MVEKKFFNDFTDVWIRTIFKKKSVFIFPPLSIYSTCKVKTKKLTVVGVKASRLKMRAWKFAPQVDRYTTLFCISLNHRQFLTVVHTVMLLTVFAHSSPFLLSLHRYLLISIHRVGENICCVEATPIQFATINTRLFEWYFRTSSNWEKCDVK